MEALSGLWSLSPLGALVGFIALFGVFLARGLLVTRREVEARIAAVEKGHKEAMDALKEGQSRMLEQYAERLEEWKDRGNGWKEAYQTEVVNSDEWRSQAVALAEVGRTTKHIIEQLPASPQNGGHTGAMESR